MSSITRLAALSAKPSPRYEIRVAFVGNGRVGKSTTNNATLRSTFSPVSILKETSKVCCFRIRGDGSGGAQDQSIVYHQLEESNKAADLNAPLETKVEDVNLDFFEMRKDTDVYICDVPGLDDDAQSEHVEYYLRKHWTELDVVITVLDSTKAASYAGNRKVLELVEELRGEKRAIPHIVVLNKMDLVDKDDSELRKEDYKDLVNEISKGSAEFVPCSSQTAQMLYATRNQDKEDFKKTPFGIIEAAGPHDCMPQSAWDKIEDEDTKYQHVYNKYSHDEDAWKERLDESNFEEFLVTLKQHVFGEENQKILIASKLEFQQKNLGKDGLEGLVGKLKRTCDQWRGLGVSIESVPETIWAAYKREKDLTFSKINGPLDLPSIIYLLAFLKDYFRFTTKHGWVDENKKAAKMLKDLITDQVSFAANKYKEQRDVAPSETLGGDATFKNMTFYEWESIFQDLTLALSDSDFRLEFFQELKWLKILEKDAGFRGCADVGDVGAMTFQLSTGDHRLRPKDPNRYHQFSRFPPAQDPTDPKSWCFAACEVFKFIKDEQNKEKPSVAQAPPNFEKTATLEGVPQTKTPGDQEKDSALSRRLLLEDECHKDKAPVTEATAPFEGNSPGKAAGDQKTDSLVATPGTEEHTNDASPMETAAEETPRRLSLRKLKKTAKAAAPEIPKGRPQKKARHSSSESNSKLPPGVDGQDGNLGAP